MRFLLTSVLAANLSVVQSAFAEETSAELDRLRSLEASLNAYKSKEHKSEPHQSFPGEIISYAALSKSLGREAQAFEFLLNLISDIQMNGDPSPEFDFITTKIALEILIDSNRQKIFDSYSLLQILDMSSAPTRDTYITWTTPPSLKALLTEVYRREEVPYRKGQALLQNRLPQFYANLIKTIHDAVVDDQDPSRQWAGIELLYRTHIPAEYFRDAVDFKIDLETRPQLRKAYKYIRMLERDLRRVEIKAKIKAKFARLLSACKGGFVKATGSK